MAKLIDAEVLANRIHEQLATIEDGYGRGELIFREQVYALIDILIRESRIEKIEKAEV